MTNDEIVKAFNQIAADLDRLATYNETTVSWESAAHLRNRANGDIRRIARRAQDLAAKVEGPR